MTKSRSSTLQWLEHKAEARLYEDSCVTSDKFSNLSVPLSSSAKLGW